jgi:hypothetical protein
MLSLKITDRKTGEQKLASDTMAADSFVHKGNPVVPLMMRLPLNSLQPGSYHLEVTCGDSSGTQMRRSADFEIPATAPAVGWDKN